MKEKVLDLFGQYVKNSSKSWKDVDWNSEDDDIDNIFEKNDYDYLDLMKSYMRGVSDENKETPEQKSIREAREKAVKRNITIDNILGDELK